MTDQPMERLLADEAERMERETGAPRNYVRIPPAHDPAQVYSVRIPVARLEELRRVAQARQKAPSTLMREWVLERLDMELPGRSQPQLLDTLATRRVWMTVTSRTELTEARRRFIDMSRRVA